MHEKNTHYNVIYSTLYMKNRRIALTRDSYLIAYLIAQNMYHPTHITLYNLISRSNVL